MYKVTGKFITKTDTIDEKCFGGNKSAEGGDDEGCDGNVQSSGVNVAMSNNLNEVQLSKKEFADHFKTYSKKLLKSFEEDGKTEEEINHFKAGAKNAFSFLKTHHDDLTFYTGETDSYFADGGWLIPCLWEGEECFLYYWKDGLKGCKC